jgi:hypothetical protein
MVYRAGELRADPVAGEADDAEGWPGFDGNDVTSLVRVVVATTSLSTPLQLLLVVTEKPGGRERQKRTMPESATGSN